ncbi:MAG TPA: hypothetical protein PK323_05515 [Bacteroidia bacterium]|nr:hypothetical protein [Bacteroidia bacterium]
MIKRFLFLFAAFSLYSGVISAQEPFKIYGKYMVNGGSVLGAKISIEKNGVRVKVLEQDKAKFEFPLEYDCDYVFSFMKDGYVTKKVQVSTKVPKEKQSLEFESFKFDVEIFKQYPGVNTVIYNQPVGKIRFNDVLNEFDYDTDYTKSIQSEITKADEALKEKAKEELKLSTAVVKTTTQAVTTPNGGGVDLSKALGEGLKPKNEQKGNSEPKLGSSPMPTKTVALTGIVTMGSYTAAVYLNPNMKTYGWINYGDNAGRVEIATKEEYEAKYKEYMEK